MRTSAKSVKEMLALLNTEDTKYELIRHEYPTGTGYRYKYLIGIYKVAGMFLELTDYATEELTLKEIDRIALQMVKKDRGL